MWSHVKDVLFVGFQNKNYYINTIFAKSRHFGPVLAGQEIFGRKPLNSGILMHKLPLIVIVAP